MKFSELDIETQNDLKKRFEKAKDMTSIKVYDDMTPIEMIKFRIEFSKNLEKVGIFSPPDSIEIKEVENE